MGTNYPIRVTVTGTTTTSHGHYELQVYLPNANPDISNPIYQASGDLTGESLVMH